MDDNFIDDFNEKFVKNINELFFSYPNDNNGDRLKAAMESVEIIFDGENVFVVLPDFKINYTNLDMKADYTFDLSYGVSLSEIGLASIDKIGGVNKKCVNLDSTCVENYFSDYNVVQKLGISCLNYDVAILTSKKQYFFNEEVNNIKTGIILGEMVGTSTNGVFDQVSGISENSVPVSL